MTVSAGDVIGEKYRVERLLGRGGMGYVVAARHLTLDQVVAIKFLRKRKGSDDQALARFRQEAKACVQLRSEHVAGVIDVGIHGSEPFIVMEYLHGADLDVTTDGGRVLPISEACDYIIQACDGLAEAHAAGIIHRDIKLPNLFLTKTAAGDPLLKVLDFGVSKNLLSDPREGDFTRTAECLGSPKYMSPEQMTDARDVDPRTDVWSLGVCLYRLLAGRPPFDGETIGRVCTMVLHELPPSISAFHPGFPFALEAVIACALQKDRAFRFSNVAELAAALAPFATSPDQAMQAVERMSAVLGVRPPSMGFLPPPPPLLTTGIGFGFDGPGAWAHTTRVRAAYRRPREMRVYYAAMALFVLAVGVKVIRPQPGAPPLARRAFAAHEGKPAVTAPALPPVRVPMARATAPTESMRVSPPIPQGDPTPVVAVPATVASPPGAVPHKRTRGRGAKTSKVRDDEALTAGDQTAIPPDRK